MGIRDNNNTWYLTPISESCSKFKLASGVGGVNLVLDLFKLASGVGGVNLVLQKCGLKQADYKFRALSTEDVEFGHKEFVEML